MCDGCLIFLIYCGFVFVYELLGTCWFLCSLPLVGQIGSSSSSRTSAQDTTVNYSAGLYGSSHLHSGGGASLWSSGGSSTGGRLRSCGGVSWNLPRFPLNTPSTAIIPLDISIQTLLTVLNDQLNFELLTIDFSSSTNISQSAE